MPWCSAGAAREPHALGGGLAGARKIPRRYNAVHSWQASIRGLRTRSDALRMTLPSQQHVYMETQVAVAVPGEEGTMTIHSGTQSLDAVQQAVAGVLGIQHHKVDVGGCRCRDAWDRTGWGG